MDKFSNFTQLGSDYAITGCVTGAIGGGAMGGPIGAGMGCATGILQGAGQAAYETYLKPDNFAQSTVQSMEPAKETPTKETKGNG